MSSRFKIMGRGRNAKRGKKNKNETKYAEHLDALKQRGEIADYWFEPLSLRVTDEPAEVIVALPQADDEGETGFSIEEIEPPKKKAAKTKAVRYTPDFMILMPDGAIILDDIKAKATRAGKTYDDPASIVRLKAAASRYPLFVFRVVRPISGGWEMTEI